MLHSMVSFVRRLCGQRRQFIQDASATKRFDSRGARGFLDTDTLRTALRQVFDLPISPLVPACVCLQGAGLVLSRFTSFAQFPTQAPQLIVEIDNSLPCMPQPRRVELLIVRGQFL